MIETLLILILLQLYLSDRTLRRLEARLSRTASCSPCSDGSAVRRALYEGEG